MKIDYSLTDISSLQTCSCSTCTCSNEYLQSNYDCLTYILVILYENSVWCIGIIYELFFKSFYQIIQEFQYRLREDYPAISLHRNTEEMNDSWIVVVPVRSVYCQTETSVRCLHETLCKESQTEWQSSVENNSQPFFFERKQRRMTDDRRIPLVLKTSLHSNASLNNADYFIRQLFTGKHDLH